MAVWGKLWAVHQHLLRISQLQKICEDSQRAGRFRHVEHELSFQHMLQIKESQCLGSLMRKLDAPAVQDKICSRICQPTRAQGQESLHKLTFEQQDVQTLAIQNRSLPSRQPALGMATRQVKACVLLMGEVKQCLN